ncbi:MAG: ABC transporter substrate-binding protein [Methylococcaceae bacterium]|nr:ABC transporter substrate-binding protein [Methylococcaceae bacterium]
MNLAGKRFWIGLCLLTAVTTVQATPKKAAGKLEKRATSTRAAISTDKLRIGYLSQEKTKPANLPFFLSQPADEGIQGARLGIADNNTTGRFTRQGFELKEILLPAEADAISAFKQLVAEGYRHILVRLPGESIAALAKLPEAGQILIYNLGSRDDRLRGETCSANLLHLLPSRAMQADALVQYLNKKRWHKVFLVTGPDDGDRLYAAAVKRAATHFGVKIVEEKPWRHDFDERRTPEAEIPVFTQGVDYDVLVVADEAGSFGDLFAYRTWQPRPVAGTSGLVPSGWHFTLEQWGALQLQNRFRDQARRWMTEEDYAGWLAVRAVGEAASRTRSTDFDKLKTFMLGDQFALAGFKGVPLSFRPWDGQMRQPILLATERSLVAVAPIEGFLHPKSELDTLGYDQLETPCHANK